MAYPAGLAVDRVIAKTHVFKNVFITPFPDLLPHRGIGIPVYGASQIPKQPVCIRVAIRFIQIAGTVRIHFQLPFFLQKPGYVSRILKERLLPPTYPLVVFSEFRKIPLLVSQRIRLARKLPVRGRHFVRRHKMFLFDKPDWQDGRFQILLVFQSAIYVS